jgi:excisionase family DNA binding protein
MSGAQFEALEDLVKYERPTRSGVDVTGSPYVDDLPADGLIERAATFVRTLGDTRLAAELRTRAERFESMVKPDSFLEGLRKAACDRVSSGFDQRERTLGGGLVWSESPRRRLPDGCLVRPAKVVIPNAQHVVECVESIDTVKWNLPGVAATLDAFLALELEPQFPGRDAVQGFQDEVCKVLAAEETDRIWGCFLLTQCETAIGQGRKPAQQILKRLGRAQEKAMKDAARQLDNYRIPRMRRRRAALNVAGAEQPQNPTQAEKVRAGQKQTAASGATTAEFLTPPQVAKHLGLSRDKVLGWIRSGELPAINAATKQGGRPRYLVARKDVTAFQARRSALPPPPPSPRKKPPKQDGIIEFY